MNDDLGPVAKVLMGVVSAKFGPGVIGRIGTIAIAGFVVMCLTAIVFAFIDRYIAFGCFLLMAALLFYVLHRAFNYAEKHPELSAMDGAQVTRLLTQQASQRPLDGLPPPPEFVVMTTENPMIEGRKVEP
jgi:phage-related holin